MRRKTDIEWVIELIEKAIVWGVVSALIVTIVYAALVV